MKTYLTKIQETVEFYNDYNQDNINYITQKDNLLLGANLYNFLPQIPHTEYNSIHKGCLMNQSLAGIEESMTELLEDVTSNIGSENFTSKIFCTFHYASYRLVCPYLIKSNINLGLVVADKPYKEQSGKYYEQINNIKKYYNVNPSFEVINAENANAFKKMINILKNGGNLLLYVDGNTGVNEKISNLHIIDFLNHKFYSRKGIPILSYLTKSDIIPVIMNRGASLNEHSINFYDKIPALKNKKEEDIKETLNKIYYNLELLITDNPHYWECWLYLNRYYLNYNLIKPNPTYVFREKYKFNKKRFSTTSIKNHYYLFDRLSAKMTTINKYFNDKFINDDVEIEQTTKDMMIKKNILI